MSWVRYKFHKVIKTIYSKISLVKKPIDENNVEILTDEQFVKSINEVLKYSMLDTDRLANLWDYCRLSNPNGDILEIGSYKGGGALHLSNSQPSRKIYICDSFEGFETIDEKLDVNFNLSQFKDTTIYNVAQLFSSKNRNFEIKQGFFPSSFQNVEFPKISFVHLDVDIYKATLESLFFLDDKMIEKSFIIIDDYNRKCEGVNKAVEEFLSQSNNWRVFPLFPSQGLLIHKSWFL